MNRKFPVSLQHDAMLCGIACLQMVCDFYGKNYTSKHLSKLCSVTTEGVSLFSIDETAKILGFHTLCARIETNILLKVSSPCILHWNQITSSSYTKSKRAESSMSLTLAKVL